MDNPNQTKPLFYVDDGHPESSDYDSNYIRLDGGEPKTWVRAILGWPRPAPAATQTTASADPPGTTRR